MDINQRAQNTLLIKLRRKNNLSHQDVYKGDIT